jgi:hypothetical protein
MSRHLKYRPIKANARLGKAWDRKQEAIRDTVQERWYPDPMQRKPMQFLEVIPQGQHRLQRITNSTAKMYINTPGFKNRIEPEGKMSVSRVNTPIGAEYSLTFAGEEEWEYIKTVFMALAFLASK